MPKSIRTPRRPNSKRTPPPGEEVFDRCASLPETFSLLTRVLLTARIDDASKAAPPTDPDTLWNFSPGHSQPHDEQLARLYEAVDLSEAEVEREMDGVVAALEARGTWLFDARPWEREAGERLRTRSGDGAAYAQLPWLLSGSWLREELKAIVAGSPLPGRTPRDQAVAFARANAENGPGTLDDASVPSLADLAAALNAAAAIRPPDDACSFRPDDGTAIGDALDLSNLLRAADSCATSSQVVWFSPTRSPRAEIWRQDEDGQTPPLPGDLIALRPARPLPSTSTGAPHQAPAPADNDEALVDLFARLAIAARRRKEAQ